MLRLYTMHLLLLLAVLANSLILSLGDKCPNGTEEYYPSKVCYIFLRWHEVANLNDQGFGKKGTNFVSTKDQALKMCQAIEKVEKNDRTTNWTESFNKIAPKVDIRLPMPKTKEHLEYLMKLLYDPYQTKNPKKVNRGRMFLGTNRTNSPNLLNAMDPVITNKGFYTTPGDCGYLYRGEIPVYSTQAYHGLHWVDCNQPLIELTRDIDNTNELVGCEFDMPKDCEETKICEFKDDKCVETSHYAEQHAHPLGKQCTPNGNGIAGNPCKPEFEQRFCKTDCELGDYLECMKCNEDGKGVQHKQVKEQPVFGGAKCNRERTVCDCNGNKANSASRFLIVVLMMAICIKKNE